MLSHIPSSSGLSRNENGRLCHEHLAGGLRGLVGGVVRGEIWQHIYPKNHYSVLRDQSPNFRVAALNKERKNPFMYSILCYKLHERQLMEGFGFREFTQRTTIIIAVEVLQHNCHNCQGASCKFLRPHLYSWIRPTLEYAAFCKMGTLNVDRIREEHVKFFYHFESWSTSVIPAKLPIVAFFVFQCSKWK